MKQRIRKIGNSSGVIIPQSLLKELGMPEIQQIIIKPGTKLTDLCGSVKPIYPREEVRKKIREMRENW